jgi:hypothetical protein
LLPALMKPVVLLTVIETGTVAPAATENVAEPVVGAMVKLSVLGPTDRLTVVVVFAELVGVMVMVCGADGSVILGRVEIVNVVVAFAVPLKLTLGGLKLQLAPVGNPIQLLGVKFTTIPVEPLPKGAMVSVVEVCWPAGTGLGLRAAGGRN